MSMKAALSFLITLSFGFSAVAENALEWSWGSSSCQDCGLKIQILSPEDNQAFMPEDKIEILEIVPKSTILQHNVRLFVEAIENEKANIIRIYGSDPQEYNLLANMAIGILGNESEFFMSTRYFLKRRGHLAITAIKKAHELWDSNYKASPNSSGPTQIKVVPKLIAEHYGVTQATMRKWPAHAAFATMGYLIEALRELKQRAANGNLTFITPETYVDYLPYLYFGRVELMKSGKAEPHKNKYIIKMKHYMQWVRLYETFP